MFEEFVPINEALLAKRAGYSTDQVVAILQKLHQLKMVEYRPSTGLPKLTFVGGRLRKQDLLITKTIYEQRIELIRERILAALHFVSTDKVCRGQMLLKYFGETDSKHCGKCDVCRSLLSVENDATHLNEFIASIESEVTIEELISIHSDRSEKEVLKTIQLLLDNNELVYHMNGKIGIP
jgi:ATP-dependent DNA helicase RecQ